MAKIGFRQAQGSRQASRRPGCGRTQKLAHTHVENHHPDVCAGCGNGLSCDAALAYTVWDEIDITEKVAGQIGVLDETIREAGRAVAPLEDEMVQDIEQAVLLHVDETP